MSVDLDKKALEAAAAEFDAEFNGTYSGEELVAKVVRAYLSALPEDVAEQVKRLRENLASFDAEVAFQLSNEGERADLWTEIDVEVEDLRILLGTIQSLSASLAAAEGAIVEKDKALECVKAAISWIEAPFVNENTPHDELMKRVVFCVADAGRALAATSPAGDHDHG